MIDRATIERINDSAQIVEVVSEFVTLKRAGTNYKGLCPFHNDRTPSFMVSPAKGLYKCFSCGKGGNVVKFVMEHEQMTYVEALRWLANKYHIEIKERELTDEERENQSRRESLFIANEFARDFFQDTLHNSVDGRAIGMQYFRSRGFRDDIIKKFQLGFSPKQTDALSTEAKAKGYNEAFLIETGLCIKRDDGTLYDRFNDRVIFPVHNITGKIVAFGGRKLDLATKGVQQKYVNSPESEIYSKKRELYGIFQAKARINAENCCFLVEGYTDVISMHQCGIENVVASSGTSLTTEQIRLIRRFTQNMTVLYDGDEAGIHAALRGTDMLLSEGMNVKVLLLPDGDDPDSFARKHNATEFKDYIEKNQTDFIKFKTNLLMKDAGNDPQKRVELIESIVTSIAAIPDGIARSVYVRECSQMLNIKEEVLVSSISKLKANEQSANKSGGAQNDPGATNQETPIATANISDTNPLYENEINIMRLIIRHGDKEIGEVNGQEGNTQSLKVAQFIYSDMSGDNITFATELHNEMMHEVMEHINDEGFEVAKYFFSHPDQRMSQLAMELASDRYQLSKSQQIIKDEDRLFELAQQFTLEYKCALIDEEIKITLKSLNDPTIKDNMEETMKRMKRFKELSDVKNSLSRLLGDRVVNN